MPYWLLFSVFAAGAVQYPTRRGALPGFLLGAGAVLAALMIGLRYEVGCDWGAYIMLLQSVSHMSLGAALARGDPGYSLFNWLASEMGLGIWAVNLACALVFTWGLLKFARRQHNPWLAVAVAVPYLIIVVAMGYTRQAVAIGLIMAALAHFERKFLVRFAFYVILATLFHRTAIVVLPLIALAVTQNRIIVSGILLSLGLILFYLFTLGSVDQLTAGYITAEYSSQGATIRVLMNLLAAILFLVLQNRMNLPLLQKRVWRSFSWAAVALTVGLLISPSSTAVDRIALYLIPLQLFVFARVPYVLAPSRGVNSQMLLLVLLYSATVQFVWLNFAQHAGCWVPYSLGIDNGT